MSEGLSAGKATVKIEPDARGFSEKTHAAVESEGGRFHEVGKKIGEHLVEGLSVLGIGVGIGKVFEKGFEEYKAADAIQAQFKAGIESTGNAAHLSVGHMDELAKSVSGYSGQSYDSIGKTEQVLQTFTNLKNSGPHKIFDDATKAAANMAAKMGGDASGSAIQLGKALQDPVHGMTALRRVGVTFDEQQQKTIKGMVAAGNVTGAQTIILKELNKEFGGAAKAYGETLPGSIARARNAWGEFTKGIVSGSGPGLATFIGHIADVLEKITPAAERMSASVSKAITMAAGKVKLAWETVVAAFQGKKMDSSGLGQWAKPLQDLGKNILPLVKQVVQLYQAFSPLSIILKALGPTLPSLADLLANLVPLLTQLVKAATSVVKAFVAWVVPLLKTQTGMAILKAAVIVLVAAFAGMKVLGVITGILNVMKGAMTAFTLATYGMSVAEGEATLATKLAALAGGLYAAVVSEGTIGAKLAAAAQWLWNAALDANPIGIVVVAIAALVAGLVWFFTQTKVGREMWANFTRFLGEAWQNVVKFVKPGIDAIVNGWNGLVKFVGGLWKAVAGFFHTGVGQVVAFLFPLFGIVNLIINNWGTIAKVAQTVFKAVGTVVGWAFNNVIKPAIAGAVVVFKGIGTVIGWLWKNVAVPAFKGIQVVIGVVAGVIKRDIAIWGTIFKGIGTVIGWLWKNVAVPAFKGIQVVIAAVAKVIKTDIQIAVVVFKAIGVVIGWLWKNVAVPAFKAIGVIIQVFRGIILIVAAIVVVTFRAIGTVIMWLWNNVAVPAFKAIGVVIKVVAAIIKTDIAIAQTVIKAIGTVIMWLWNNVAVPAFKAIGVAVNIVKGIILIVAAVVVVAFRGLATVVTWLWKNVVEPAMKGIGVVINWLKTNVVDPVFKGIQLTIKTYSIIFTWLWQNVVQPAMKGIGTVINWLKTNIVDPVFKAIGAAIKVVGGVFTWLWNNCIAPAFKAVGTIIQGFWTVVSNIFGKVASFIHDTLTTLVTTFTTTWGFIFKAVGDALGKIWTAVTTTIGKVIDFFAGVGQKIIGAIGDAGKMLWDVGVNIIKGLISGITSMVKGVMDAVGKVVKGAVDWAKSVLGIKSPSRVFHEIGRNTGQGLANGIDSTREKVKDSGKKVAEKVKEGWTLAETQKAAANLGKTSTDALVNALALGREHVKATAAGLKEEVKAAFDAGKINSAAKGTLVDLIDTDNKRLLKLAADRKAIGDKIKAVKDQIVKDAKDAGTALAQSAIDAGNIANSVQNAPKAAATQSVVKVVNGKKITEQVKAQAAANSGANAIIAGLKTAIANARTFRREIAELKKLHIDKTSLKQIIDAGVTGGGMETAKALLDGGHKSVKEVGSLQKKLQGASKSLGKTTTSAMKSAGMAAADGLVAGLKANHKKITTEMESIGAAMVKAIKKKLAIHSPSRVMHEVGGFTGDGFADGIRASKPKVVGAMNDLVAVPKPSGWDNLGRQVSAAAHARNSDRHAAMELHNHFTGPMGYTKDEVVGKITTAQRRAQQKVRLPR